MTTRYDYNPREDSDFHSHAAKDINIAGGTTLQRIIMQSQAVDGVGHFNFDTPYAEVTDSVNLFIDRHVSDVSDSVMRRNFDFEQGLNVADISARSYLRGEVEMESDDYFTARDVTPKALFRGKKDALPREYSRGGGLIPKLESQRGKNVNLLLHELIFGHDLNTEKVRDMVREIVRLDKNGDMISQKEVEELVRQIEPKLKTLNVEYAAEVKTIESNPELKEAEKKMKLIELRKHVVNKSIQTLRNVVPMDEDVIENLSEGEILRNQVIKEHEALLAVEKVKLAEERRTRQREAQLQAALIAMEQRDRMDNISLYGLDEEEYVVIKDSDGLLQLKNWKSMDDRGKEEYKRHVQFTAFDKWETMGEQSLINPKDVNTWMTESEKFLRAHKIKNYARLTPNTKDEGEIRKVVKSRSEQIKEKISPIIYQAARSEDDNAPSTRQPMEEEKKESSTPSTRQPMEEEKKESQEEKYPMMDGKEEKFPISKKREREADEEMGSRKQRQTNKYSKISINSKSGENLKPKQAEYLKKIEGKVLAKEAVTIKQLKVYLELTGNKEPPKNLKKNEILKIVSDIIARSREGAMDINE